MQKATAIATTKAAIIPAAAATTNSQHSIKQKMKTNKN